LVSLSLVKTKIEDKDEEQDFGPHLTPLSALQTIGGPHLVPLSLVKKKKKEKRKKKAKTKAKTKKEKTK